MISEGSRDTVDWSDDAENSSFTLSVFRIDNRIFFTCVSLEVSKWIRNGTGLDS